MKNRNLIIFLVLATIAWFIGSSYYYVCKIRGNCDPIVENLEKPMETKAVIPNVNGLQITDGSALNISNPDDVYFDTNGSTLFIENPLKVSFDELAAYMEANPEKKLIITGKYTKSEGDSNLGLSRANSFIMTFCKRYNLDKSRFNKSFLEVASLPMDLERKRTYNALSFDFNIDKALSDSESDDEDLSIMKANLLKKRIVYFDSGSSNMNTNAKIHQFFADLNYYISKVPNAKALVVGHTDSDGSTTTNLKLSQARAKDVKNYLLNNHDFPGNAFTIRAKGEKSPITDNSTEEGRAKNRRVEIQLAQ